jgi:hypothetical protein
LKKLGHPPDPLVQLPLRQCAGGGDFVSRTDEWLLTPPPDIRGRASVYCSIEPDGSSPGPTITSVSYSSAETTEHTTRSHQVQIDGGGIDIVKLPTAIEVGTAREYTASATVIAALDPNLFIDALFPGSGELEKYIYEYLGGIAPQYGLSQDDLATAFFDEYAHLIRAQPGKMDVQVSPERLVLEPGESQTIKVTVVADGPVHAFFVVRGSYEHNNALHHVVSDLVEIVTDGEQPFATAEVDLDNW